MSSCREDDGRHWLLPEKAAKFLEAISVWRLDPEDISVLPAFGDRTLIAEALEAGFAMISAHPACSDATKRKMVIAGWFEGVVETETARCDRFCDASVKLATRGEGGESQGGWTLLEPGECLIEVSITDDGKDGAEDLLLHGGHVPASVRQDARCEVALDWIVRADCDRIIGDEFLQPLEVVIVDDASQISTEAWTIPSIQFPVCLLNEVVVERIRNENEVRSNTGLAGVEELGGDQSLNSFPEIQIAVENGRALAPQFEDGRRKVGGGGLGVETSDLFSSGEEEQVKGQLEKGCSHRAIPLDYHYMVRVKGLADDLCQKGRGRWGEFRGFEKAAVSGSYGGNKRAQRKLDGIVPWSRDQGPAEWFPTNFAPSGKEVEGCFGSLGSRPARQGAETIFDFGKDEVEFGEPGFEGRFTEIGGESVKGIIGTISEGGLECAQGVQPSREWKSRARAEELPLPLEGFLEVGAHGMRRREGMWGRRKERREARGEAANLKISNR